MKIQIYKKVTQIQQNLDRKIEWIGKFKNSLLDKTNYLNNNFELIKMNMEYFQNYNHHLNHYLKELQDMELDE